MGFGAWWHWVLIALIVLVVFGGKGKLSGLMGDAAKGVKAFRDGLKDGDDKPAETAAAPLPRPESEKDKA
ncbi:MAG: twin-arginine translocase TatA/TatE family subunit [Caulobacteraceae bacterium]|nr:twin-arginine translocase TatA/TatE family subunit [Caulobacteraceae bacterium]